MEVAKYKLITKRAVDWELTIPTNMTDAEYQIVTDFLKNKRVACSFIHQNDAKILLGAASCELKTISMIETKIIHYTDNITICKVTD